MKAPPFAYARAETAEEAVALLAAAGEDAKVIAGGQSLTPLLAYRLVRPTHLVDVDRMAGHDAITPGAETTVGALVRHAALERAALSGAHRLVALAAARVGHLPIRTRGTLGGSVAHADPAAELPLAVLTLDGEVVARSAAGTRRIPAAEFFTGPFTTALDPAELVVAVALPPAPAGARAAFAELSLRAGDFALAAVAAAVARDDTGRVSWARVGLAGVGGTPMRADTSEQALLDRALDDATIADAAREAASACAGAADRRRLVETLVRDALGQIRAEAP